MEFEEFLEKCGNSGRYQYMLLVILWLIATVTGFQFLSQTFIGTVPEHWCYHAELENRSFDEIRTIYAQFENPSCTRLESISGNNVTVSSERCDRWIYNYDFGFKSMNTELNWVCDSAYKSRVGQSLFFVGNMLGTPCLGLLGDRIGRLRTMILANLICCLGEGLNIFSDNVLTFSISRFISGIGTLFCLFPMSIIVLEYVSPKLRSVAVSTAVSIGVAGSLFIESWLPFWVGHWRIFLLFTSLPLLLVAFVYFVVQESAQWLITRNDIDGAIKRLRRVAKFNGKTVSEEDFTAFYRDCEKSYRNSIEKSQSKLSDVLNWPHLRRRFCVLVCIAVILCVTSNIVTRNVDGLGISPFILFRWHALSVLSSALLQAHIQQRYGRKSCVIVALIGSGVSAIGLGAYTSLDHNSYRNVILAFGVIMKCFSSMSVQTGSQYSTELIPTAVRSRGVGFIQFTANVGGFLTPYIQHMSIYLAAIPFAVVSLFVFLGAYLCLLLPDTKDKILPISLEDGNEFGKNEQMFDFINKKQIEKDAQMDGKRENLLSEEEI